MGYPKFLAPLVSEANGWLHPVGKAVSAPTGGVVVNSATGSPLAPAAAGESHLVLIAGIIAAAVAVYYFIFKKGDTRHKHKY